MDLLSKRELEVLLWMTKGLSNNEIGKILSISKHTVKAHTSSVFKKLSVRDRVEAAYLAGKYDLV